MEPSLVRHVATRTAQLSAASALVLAFAAASKPASAQPVGVASASASGSASVAAPASASATTSAAPSGSAEPPPDVPPAGSAAAPIAYATCIEHLPTGSRRPQITEQFPARGLAGYALELVITVRHGAGETVLPQGFVLRDDATGLSEIRKAGFSFPVQNGPGRARIEPSSVDGGAQTKVTIPVIGLPKEAGSKELTLPPLPISVARASGEVMTLCTVPHTVRVDDPTANFPVASVKPKGNPGGRRQLEDWAAARAAAIVSAVALVSLLLGALLARWWRRRPKILPPPPPPRPPWEIALSELDALRSGPLLGDGKLAEFVDALSDIARRYLGARFGFDGVESTSREVRKAMRGVTPPLPVLPDIEILLDESDLVKFARVIPSLDACTTLADRVESIVRLTIPTLAPLVAPSVSAASASPSRAR